MFKKYFLFSTLLFTAFFGLFVLLAPQAEAFDLFPGESTALPTDGKAGDYRVYIKNFYIFAIAAGTLIATVLIMVGGIIWVTSAGNPERIGKAKSFIIDSLMGVVLLMSAYTILQFLNPNLVNLQLPTLQNLTFGSCISPRPNNDPSKSDSCSSSNQSQCCTDAQGKNICPPNTYINGKSCNETCYRIEDKEGAPNKGRCIGIEDAIKEEIQKSSELRKRCNDTQTKPIEVSEAVTGRDVSICREECSKIDARCFKSVGDVEQKEVDWAVNDILLCKCVWTE